MASVSDEENSGAAGVGTGESVEAKLRAMPPLGGLGVRATLAEQQRKFVLRRGACSHAGR